MLMTHPHWGVIALPILSMLYVRQCDVAALDAKYGWKFQTKLELALQMITRVVQILRALGSKAKMLAVFDGAYSNGLRPAMLLMMPQIREAPRIDIAPSRTNRITETMVIMPK